MSNLSLPTAEDSEKGFLCSFMLNPEGVNELCVFRKITPDWFNGEDHKTIFLGLQEMLKLKKPFDLHTVTHFFEDRRKGFVLLDSNVVAKITEIYCHVETALNAEYYLSRLQLTYAKRLGMISCRSAEQEFKSATEIQEVFNLSQKALLGVSEVCQEQEAVDHQKRNMLAFIEKMEKAATGEAKPEFFPTGLPMIDTECGGLVRGELLLIRGLKGTGKSLLSQRVITTNAFSDKKAKVAVFTYEMPYDQYLRRIIADIGTINLRSMRDGRYDKGEFNRFQDAVARAASSNLHIYDTQLVKRTPYAFFSAVRAHKRKHGLDIVVLDHLHLLKFSEGKKVEKRADESLHEFSAEFKSVCLELKIVGILLAQENTEGGTFGGSQVETDVDSSLSLTPVRKIINGVKRIVGTDGAFCDKFREGNLLGRKIPLKMSGQYARIEEIIGD